MKPAEIIIKETHLKNQSRCTITLKGDKEISVIGEPAILFDKDGNYKGCGFGTRIEKIRFDKSDIYPLFEIEPDKYDNPKILRSVRAAIAGAIIDYCSDKDPDKYSVVHIYDYTPEAEIDENGIKWRLPPTTKIIQKTVIASEVIRHFRNLVNKAKKMNDIEWVKSLEEGIKSVSKNFVNFTMDEEVPIDSTDKDGDLYHYPDEYEEATPIIEQPSTPSSEEPSPIPSREKLSIKSFSDEKEMICSCSNSPSEVSEKNNTSYCMK